MADLTTEVLIVGAGPSGMTTALALTDYGIDHVLVEKYSGTAHTPRAHIVNQRTTEIMRHLGLEKDLEAISTPQDLMQNSIWYTTLNRREVARFQAWGTEPHKRADYIKASPSQLLNCAQNRFEPMLVDALCARGSEVMFRREFITAERDGNHWISTIRSLDDDSTLTVRSRYIVGADGGRSTVLGLAGLTVEGESGIYHAANIWFNADLSKYFAHRPGVLSWNVHPGPQPPMGMGTFICHQPFTEFILVRFYDPAQEDLTKMSDDDAKALIERAVGEPVTDIEILGISGWQVNSQVAPQFSKENIFCMGDAVHRHPPTNGLGLNMSVADGFNLAWKLALVINGRAGADLLDSYSAERQPIDAAGVKRAITSQHEAASFRTALGYEPDMTEEEGWKALDVLDDPGHEGEERRTALRKALESTDYRFNAIGLELGYRYETGALLDSEPGPTPTPNADPILHFTPTTRPGARVPHARIERDGVTLSTLDLVDGLKFALFVGLDAAHWRKAVQTIAAELGITVDVHQIGGPDILDPYFEWEEAREVDHSGAVLVRPDRHVGWRSMSKPKNSTDSLREALRAVLALD